MMSKRIFRMCAGFPAALLLGPEAMAEDVIVTVTGVTAVEGEVACRLYNGPRNFPFGKGTAGQVRMARGAEGTACSFSNVAPGTFAVVAALLPKGQDDVSRDFLGRPRQPWGVSNNVRFATRPPRFDEAAFSVERGKATRLRITLAR